MKQALRCAAELNWVWLVPFFVVLFGTSYFRMIPGIFTKFEEKNSCEIEYFVGTQICKLCVLLILRSRVLRTDFKWPHISSTADNSRARARFLDLRVFFYTTWQPDPFRYYNPALGSSYLAPCSHLAHWSQLVPCSRPCISTTTPATSYTCNRFGFMCKSEEPWTYVPFFRLSCTLHVPQITSWKCVQIAQTDRMTAVYLVCQIRVNVLTAETCTQVQIIQIL